MRRKCSPPVSLAVTLVIDEWQTRQVVLPDDFPIVARALGRAKNSLAFVTKRLRQDTLTHHVQGFIRTHRRLIAACHNHRIKFLTFNNPEQLIVQLRWYAADHPFKPTRKTWCGHKID